MAGSDKEVGRLSIRVVPDMDGFRAKVKEVADSAAEGKNPEIPVDADTTKAKAKIKELKDEKGRINLDVDADTAKARAELKALPNEKIKIKVESDTFALDRVKKNIDRFLTNSAMDLDKVGNKIRGLVRDMSPQAMAEQSWQRGLDKMESDLKVVPRLDETKIEEMRLRLRNENFTIKVKMDRDEASFHNMEQKLKRQFEKIDQLGGNRKGNFLTRGLQGGIGLAGGALSKLSVPDLVPNIGGLGAVGSITLIVAALSLLAPALALVGDAVIGLPALLGAVALPIGVFALGLGGIKKALDNSGLMDLVTGKKGKETQKIGEGLKEVQKQVSDVFEKGFTPMFKSVLQSLPALTRGLPFVAKGIVDFANGISQALLSPANIANFDRFTNSVSTMLTNLGPGMGSFATGITSLMTNVGDHLPGLGTVMTQWGGEFEAWVEKISKPKQWWGKDMPNSSDLDQAVSGLKPILESVKNFVGDLVATGVKLAGDPNMVKGIKDFVDGLTHLAEQVARLGPMFEGMAHLLSLIPAPKQAMVDDPKNPKGPQIPAPPPKPAPALKGYNEDDHPKTGLDLIGQWFGGGGPGRAFDAVLRSLFGGSVGAGMAVAGADSSPFNPGTKVVPGQAPIPVVPVAPAGGLSPALQNMLLPGGSAKPNQAPPMLPGVQGAQQPPVQAPKIEAPKLPPGSEKIWEPLIASTLAAGGQINAEVGSWAGKIKSALDAASAGAEGSGKAIGERLAVGIGEGEAAAVTAAHHLADAVKGALPNSPAEHGPFSGSGWTSVKNSGGAIASQFGDGLEGGVPGIIAASQRLMEAVHGSMDQNGILPPQLTAAVTKESAAIGIQLDKLKQQRDALDPKDKTGRKAIKDQMDQLNGIRTEFGLDSKQSKYNSKYGGAGAGGDSTQQAASMITQALASGLDAMKGLVMSNVTQAETDLGMSGNGVVEQLGNYGLNFLTGTINSVAQSAFGGGKNGGGGNTYNFQSMDHDGMQKNYERVKNRESMQYTQRTN